MNATFGSIIAGVALVGSTLMVSSPSHKNELASDASNPLKAVQESISSISNEPQSYIIQSNNIDFIMKKVQAIGGEVANTYPIINAVNALLTQDQYASLNKVTDLKIHADIEMETQSASRIIDSRVGTLIDSDLVNKAFGFKGDGVTIAILDSGLNYGSTYTSHISQDGRGRKISIPKYNAINRRNETHIVNNDKNGHGTHIAGIIGSNLLDQGNDYNGIAPNARLVSVKAFDKYGDSRYSVVLDGLNWIFKNRKRYNIKVLNLSIGAEVMSNYWNDPVNLAVMRLWDEGIVVVTSAGNTGKQKGIGVPGNNPYVITVGATYDNGTMDLKDDRVLSFSSRGPTYEGFIKPDVVTYGGQLAVRIDPRYTNARSSDRVSGTSYYRASGTSQSAAVVTGVAALIIQQNPNLSPDDVKCRIMSSAILAQNKHQLTYSPFTQGAGMVNAGRAIKSNARGCANQGLNIKQDLAGVTHFGGPVREKKNGEFVIIGGDGEMYTQGNHWGKNAMDLRGNHWGSSTMNVRGNSWGRKMMDLRGNQWGGKVLKLRSNDDQIMSINSLMKVNSNDKDVIPHASNPFYAWLTEARAKRSKIASPLEIEDY